VLWRVLVRCSAHILKVCHEHKIPAEVLAQVRYDIPAMYSFHTHGSKDIEVDLIRIDLSNVPDRPPVWVELGPVERVIPEAKHGHGKSKPKGGGHSKHSGRGR
jgi:hypothetical protein